MGDIAPRVSVVLTTYNRAQVLADTIHSILIQSFTDFELIVCDDHSTDETAATVQRFARVDTRVRYLPADQNLGMPRNLNRGIVAARGELVANLHDGDIYDPRLLEKWVGGLDRCPDAAFVFNAYRDLGQWSTPGTVMSLPLPSCFDGSILLRIFDRRWRFDSPVWGTVMVRKSAYTESGILDERYGFIADVDMWLRLAERYKVAYVNEPLISLPPRSALPRAFRLSDVAERRTVHAIMRASRKRRSLQFRDRVLHKATHGTFVVLDYGNVVAKAVIGRRLTLILGQGLRRSR
jgi:glycosyltransferase involved in cell wall biosynthesis